MGNRLIRNVAACDWMNWSALEPLAAPSTYPPNEGIYVYTGLFLALLGKVRQQPVPAPDGNWLAGGARWRLPVRLAVVFAGEFLPRSHLKGTTRAENSECSQN